MVIRLLWQKKLSKWENVPVPFQCVLNGSFAYILSILTPSSMQISLVRNSTLSTKTLHWLLYVVWQNQVVFLASERTLSSLKSSALTPRDRRKNSYQAANLHSRLRRCCICGRFFRLYIPRAKTLKWRQLRAQRHCRKHHHLPLHSILCGSGPKKNKYCVRAEHIWLCIPILQCAQLTTITSCAASVFFLQS